VWDKSEKSLREVLYSLSLDYDEIAGEGAFYGPKIEFTLTDVTGRKWQCGTIQLDFMMCERLDATYIDSDDCRENHPVLIHRAILGSMERFIGIMLEHYKGWIPFDFSPVQIVVCNVSEASIEYAEFVKDELKNMGIRATLDSNNDSVGYKIRKHTKMKIPITVIIGEKEAKTKRITFRINKTKENVEGDIFDTFEIVKSKLKGDK